MNSDLTPGQVALVKDIAYKVGAHVADELKDHFATQLRLHKAECDKVEAVAARATVLEDRMDAQENQRIGFQRGVAFILALGGGGSAIAIQKLFEWLMTAF